MFFSSCTLKFTLDSNLLFAFVIVSLLTLHCLLADIIFGHSTFWGHHTFGNLFSRKPSQSSSSFLIPLDKEPPKRIFRELNQLLIAEILQYLTVYELLNFQSVSKDCSLLIHPTLWNRLYRSTFPFISSVNVQSKYEYFKRLTQYYDVDIYHFLVVDQRSRPVYVLISEELYDISSFLSNHPGGDLILLEYQNKDATLPFYRAHHSKIAKSMMAQYIVWSPVRIKGKKGYPNFVKSIHQNKGHPD